MTRTNLKGAIDRRRKIAEALALADTLSEQLQMAGLVQRDFLPRQLPDSDTLKWATTFLPAEWVSGDIYDIERIDERHIGFYVADVVGHGIPAALLTIFLKQALVMRETSGKRYRIFSPAEVMTKLNERMTEQKLSGHQFVTCCYCLLNIETLQLTYARAGHPYPILIRDQQPQQLEVQGSLLGIFEKTQYVQETMQLQPCDKLLLYSDGAEPFIGNFDEQTGKFTFSRKFNEIKDLPVTETIEKFNAIVHNQKPTQPQSETDDITLVALEIHPVR